MLGRKHKIIAKPSTLKVSTHFIISITNGGMLEFLLPQV